MNTRWGLQGCWHDRKGNETDIDIYNEEINDEEVNWNEEDIQHAIVASADPFYLANGKWQNKKQDEPFNKTFINEVQTYKQGQKTKHAVINIWLD